jgi:hypothetical protein
MRGFQLLGFTDSASNPPTKAREIGESLLGFALAELILGMTAFQIAFQKPWELAHFRIPRKGASSLPAHTVLFWFIHTRAIISFRSVPPVLYCKQECQPVPQCAKVCHRRKKESFSSKKRKKETKKKKS